MRTIQSMAKWNDKDKGDEGWQRHGRRSIKVEKVKVIEDSLESSGLRLELEG